MQPVWSESGCSTRHGQVMGEAAIYHTVYNKSINTKGLEEVRIGLLTGNERTPGHLSTPEIQLENMIR